MRKEKSFVTSIFLFVDFVYELIKNSFSFWVFFLRGFGVITLYSSMRALMEVSLDILNKDRKKTFNNFKEKYYNTDKNRFLSLFLFFFLFYLLAIVLLPFPEQFEGALLHTLQYMSLFVSLILLVLLSAVPVYKFLYPNIQWTLPLIIYSFGKSFMWTALLFIGLLILFWTSINNILFFIVLTPGIFGVMCAFIFTKTSAKLFK